MKVLEFAIDNRALLEADGHSKRWHSRVGELVERLDVLVEEREHRGLAPKQLTPTVRIIPVYTPHPLLYSALALRRGLAEHRRHGYDLATTEDPFRPGVAAVLFKRRTGVPISIEYHTDAFFNPAWLRERPAINRVYDRLGRLVIAAADSVRVVNRKNQRDIMAVCRGDKLVESIPVPAAFYDPGRDGARADALRAWLGLEAEDVLVLFVGRLAPVKRVDELLRGFAALRAAHPRAHLLVVGDGPQRDELRALARRLGDERITFTGYVPEHEVFGYYGAADIFVNPAHVEPYGRVYIEAMSADLPVVTTHGAGAVEDGLCIDGENALVVPPGDLPALGHALSRLIDAPDLRAALGRRGREWARDKLDYEHSLRRMRSFWDRTVAAAGGARLALPPYVEPAPETAA